MSLELGKIFAVLVTWIFFALVGIDDHKICIYCNELNHSVRRHMLACLTK